MRLRLVSFKKSSKEPIVIKEARYLAKERASLESCLKDFLSTVESDHYPEAAHIGVAGAVFNNKNKLTNIEHWPEMDGHELAKVFNFK